MEPTSYEPRPQKPNTQLPLLVFFFLGTIAVVILFIRGCAW
jgi:hypothetical protein